MEFVFRLSSGASESTDGNRRLTEFAETFEPYIGRLVLDMVHTRDVGNWRGGELGTGSSGLSWM